MCFLKLTRCSTLTFKHMVLLISCVLVVQLYYISVNFALY